MKNRIISILLIAAMVLGVAFSTAAPVYAAGPSSGYYGDYGYNATLDNLSANAGYINFWGWAFNNKVTTCSFPTYVYKWNGSYYQHITTVNLSRCDRPDVQGAYGLNTAYVGFGQNLPLSSGWYAFRIHVTGSDYSPMAAWSEDTYKDYYVSQPTAYLNKQGGIGGTDSTLVDYGTYTHNSAVTAPTRTGYDFNGYYSGTNGTGTRYFDAAGNMTSAWWYTGNGTLYAYWTPSNYTVTLDNGGIDITEEGTTSVTATYTKSMPTISIPSRTGYTFDGYWTASTGGTKYYNADGTSAKAWDVASKATLYAHWNVNTYKITYFDGTAEITASSAAKINDSTVTKTFTYEDPVTLPTDVTKENAIFNGWYEDRSCSGEPVFFWGTQTAERTQDQQFYADWIDIDGTMAVSEKQSFSASLFDTESEAYSTAEVLVTLDGESADVNQVQLKQDGKNDLTLAGSNGQYTFTSSADLSGSWDIWVNGADSGVDLTVGTPATVELVTVSVSVTSDGTAAADRSVTLENGTDSSLTLSDTGTAGTYQLQTFADENRTYHICIDGADTGKTLNLKDCECSTAEVAFWTASVTTRKDGSAAHMGAAELRTTGASLSLTGLNGIYTLCGQEDEETVYDLYIAGLDTGFDLLFTADGREQIVDYHTVTVETRKDDVGAAMGDVTLRDGDEIAFTLTPAKETGVYSVVSQENETVYDVYVGGEDCGRDASFTDGGKTPAAADYYTVQVTTKLDGAAAFCGTVLLKAGTEALTLPSVGTGVYAMTRLADPDTEYEINIAGETVGQTARFSGIAAQKTHTVDYTSLELTLNLDGEACRLGDVVLKQKNAADIVMKYDAEAENFTGTTWHDGSYDIWLDGVDTGRNLKVGKSSSIDYYTLSYDLDGGSGNLPADKIYQEGTGITLPAEMPVKADHQFVGWSTDGTHVTFAPNTNGAYDDDITISASCHSLKAVWCENSKYQARFSKAGSSDWTYATLQYAVDYAKQHSDSVYNIEVNNSSSLTDGTEIASNVNMSVPAGVTLDGDITNCGTISLQGILSGEVVNKGTIYGTCTVAEDDTISGSGEIAKLDNKSGASAENLTIDKVLGNGGTLRNVSIEAGTGIGGAVEGTIFAQYGVLFDESLSTRYREDQTTSQAVISIAGGGTITGIGNMNSAGAFAGLMLDEGDHQLANGIIHLRSRVTVNSNQVYADLFDFTADADLVYDKTVKTPAFSSSRTPGMGEITRVLYKQVGGTPSWGGWSQWTEDVPLNVGTYQVKIDVADGEYFTGRSSVTDAVVWTFTITPKEAGLTWTAPEDLVYTSTVKEPAVCVNNLEDGDSCTVSAAVSEGCENIHVGSFTFTADALSNKNYMLPENVISDAYTIVPKPVTAQWTVISKEYTGSALTPDALLPGIETGDSAATVFDADNTKAEAGSYVLTAGLDNENYVLTNPVTNFTIQKAEAVFTVSGDLQVCDGTVKLPVVTVDPEVDFTTCFVDEDGEMVSEPSAEGEYDIYVTLSDDNYRAAGRGDGKNVKIGTLVLCGSSLPSTYAVKFEKGEGGCGSMNSMKAAKAGAVRRLPACGYTRSGYVFAGWKYGSRIYQAGETFTQPSGEVTMTAQWTEKVYEIAGAVKGADGQAKQGAVVRLMAGQRQIGTPQISGTDGGFSFEGVLPGTYNLVVSDDGVVVTTAVVITENDEVSLAVCLPEGRTSSVVEVAAGTADVVVSGLENSFGADCVNYTAADETVVALGGSVEMKLEVAENTDPAAEKQTAVEDLCGNVGMYLDMNLVKTVTDENGVKDAAKSGQLYSSDAMLEVTIPLSGELQNMSRYSVYRFHKESGDAAEVLETLDQVSSEGAHTEEGYSVSKDKTSITIYTRSFSLYALGYVKEGQKYRITKPETEHGTLRVNPSPAQSGKLVTIYAQPEEGYLLETLRVFDYRGVELPLTEVEAGSVYTFKMPARRVEIRASFVDAESLIGFFEDVYSTDYYYEAVRWAAARGITGGTDASHFSPLNITTRAQMITFLWKASGSPETEAEMPFTDVAEDAYYAKAVRWAAANGITSGTAPDTFSPDSNVTRAQAITFLNHYSGTLLGADVVASTPALCPFSDVAANAYYHDAVAWASEQKITSGTSEDKFSPDADCTRAQVITFLWKALR